MKKNDFNIPSYLYTFTYHLQTSHLPNNSEHRLTYAPSGILKTHVGVLLAAICLCDTDKQYIKMHKSINPNNKECTLSVEKRHPIRVTDFAKP